MGRAYRGCSLVPGAIGAAAGAVVGRDAERGAAVSRIRDAPCDLSGPRDHGRGPRVQPARRRTPRRARSAAPMTRIVRARREHIPAMAALMAASPLLRRYRVTGARATT